MLNFNFVFRHMLATIYWLRNETVIPNMNELLKTESLSRDELHKYKAMKLIDLIKYLRENNLYYSNLINTQSISLMQIGNKYDVDWLPILNKDTIINNLPSLLDKKLPVTWRSTSGTTGSPFIFPKDRIATGYMDAMMYNAYSWHGIEMGDNQARLWGRAIKQKQMLIQCAKDFILNRRRLSAFQMNEENCHKYFKKLLKYKPKYFYTYSNALYQFAIFVENNNLDGRALGINVAISTGEVLFSYQRQKIEDVFGCKVVNEYGSTENGIIGFECEYGKMHVMPTVYVEILDPDETGLGQILITELNSRSLPFIRYKIGDTGRLLESQCECKRPFELIEIQEGRIDDYIICPDGKLVYDAILAYTLKEYAMQFKAYQENINLLRIYIVPNINYNANSELKLIKSLHKYVGDEMLVDIIQVKELPYDTSGKFRYFVSKINKGVV